MSFWRISDILIKSVVIKMIKFAICDDEPYMVREIADQLSAYMAQVRIASYSVNCFSGGQFLLESGEDFDLIFLDIQMEHPDGMETARALRRRGVRSLLVFVTVLKEAVFDVFELQAYDYLVKPLERERFRRTMDRAVKTLDQGTEKQIMIQRGNSWEVVLLSQIVYCEVQGRKLYIHRNDGTVLDYYDRLEAFEHRVDGRFFRCHRSYLVNLAYVRGCRDGQVLLFQGEAIPVSRLREQELTQTLLRYMKERVTDRSGCYRADRTKT